MDGGTGQGADWLGFQRRWTRGPQRVILASAFLAYLVFVGQDVATYASGAREVAGFVVLGAFAAGYVVSITLIRRPVLMPVLAAWATGLVALVVVELIVARADAFIMCIYLAVLAVARFRTRALWFIAVATVAALVVPVAVGPWHDSLTTGVRNATVIAIPVVGVTAFAGLQVIEGNRALADARAELARLTAENERTRIARDLHDLLGHSLTTITVKAGLAHRMAATDLDRAMQEIAEVEAMSRRTLGDVRAAVGAYREVTLTGELATGREVLRAAGIAAELPRSVEIVGGDHQELFGWAVREGLTNVVRHSRASTCTIVLTAHSVEVLDDGVASPGRAGHGLTGLRERAAAAGARVEAGPREPQGWRLAVSLVDQGGAR